MNGSPFERVSAHGSHAIQLNTCTFEYLNSERLIIQEELIVVCVRAYMNTLFSLSCDNGISPNRQ